MTETSPALAALLELVRTMDDDPDAGGRPFHGDRRDGRVYAYTPEIALAVQVSLITSRPLLITGPPGCGKSSLAAYVARNLGFSYLEYVADADSTPQDLLWRVDLIRRLNDAQAAAIRPDRAGEKSLLDYLEPGPLWWASNPDSAARRGRSPEVLAELNIELSTPPRYIPGYEASRPGAVLLIDEIDKADNAFCNGLLVPLGSRQFSIPEAEITIVPDEQMLECSPLVIITTNNEKELPSAFIRRCIVLAIGRPTAEQLIRAAHLHFPQLEADDAIAEKVAKLARHFDVRDVHDLTGPARSTAEFLDLVATLTTMDIDLDSAEWDLIQRLVVDKTAARGSHPLPGL